MQMPDVKPIDPRMLEQQKRPTFDFWFEPLHWAVPIAIGRWKETEIFQVHIGPFGLTIYYGD